jgi:hypothetical protein
MRPPEDRYQTDISASGKATREATESRLAGCSRTNAAMRVIHILWIAITNDFFFYRQLTLLVSFRPIG